MINRPGPLARLRGMRRRRAMAVRAAVLTILGALAVTPWLVGSSVDLAERRGALAEFEAIEPRLADWSARLGEAAADLGESGRAADRAAMLHLVEQALAASFLEATARERLTFRLDGLAEAMSAAGAGEDVTGGLLELGEALDRLALSDAARAARRRELREALSEAADGRRLAGVVDIALKGVVLLLLLYVLWRVRVWEG